LGEFEKKCKELLPATTKQSKLNKLLKH